VPKKMLPNLEDIEYLQRELGKLGFRPISPIERKKDFLRFGLVPARLQPGREIGFSFSANGLSVKVWTTWQMDEGVAREQDSGWVLITSGDHANYFARPLHRTKRFCLNLLKTAWIARWRVLHRPLCPSCHQFMDITRGRGIKSRYWICKRKQRHPDNEIVRLNWDHNLPPKAKRFVTARRRKRALERKRNERETGKSITSAVLRRKPWIQTSSTHA